MFKKICHLFEEVLTVLFWVLLIFGFDSPKIAVYTIISAFLHECGHLAALRIMRKKSAPLPLAKSIAFDTAQDAAKQRLRGSRRDLEPYRQATTSGIKRGRHVLTAHTSIRPAGRPQTEKSLHTRKNTGQRTPTLQRRKP